VTAEIDVFLSLHGAKLTPDVVVARIGREPDRMRMPPGHGAHSRRYVKEPWCAFRSGLGSDRGIDEHVRALLDAMEPYAPAILALRDELGLRLVIDAVVECYAGFTPPIYFDPDVLARMTRWKAAFWIDLYTFEGTALSSNPRRADVVERE